MIWTCFSYYEVGLIHWIKTIMDQHMSKKAKKWFADNIIDVMEWPPQSPYVNPIENLWTHV